jgi:hypothetical protein
MYRSISARNWAKDSFRKSMCARMRVILLSMTPAAPALPHLEVIKQLSKGEVHPYECHFVEMDLYPSFEPYCRPLNYPKFAHRVK